MDARIRSIELVLAPQLILRTSSEGDNFKQKAWVPTPK